MDTIDSSKHIDQIESPSADSLPPEGASDVPAWQMIAAGRYQPRRIKGSCRGRELG